MTLSNSVLTLSFVTLLTLGLGRGIAAANDVGVVELPTQYMIGKAPPQSIPQSTTQGTPGVEKSTAIEKQKLDGAFYAEVFPLFNGGGGNLSFLRLGNNNAASSTFHLTVIGAPSGDVYGEADFPVPANASPQYDIGYILNTTGAGALEPTDTSYSIYINNDDGNTFFQSVIYNGGNNFFEDVTICSPGASMEGDKTLTNIHTSKLAANQFPETIYIHNLLEIPAQYKIVVRDSGTGAVLGTIASLQVNGNATYATPFSFFESKVTIPANTVHATLELHAAPGSQFESDLGAGPDPADIGVILGAAVYNTQFNAFLNLSNKCSINR